MQSYILLSFIICRGPSSCNNMKNEKYETVNFRFNPISTSGILTNITTSANTVRVRCICQTEEQRTYGGNNWIDKGCCYVIQTDTLHHLYLSVQDVHLVAVLIRGLWFTTSQVAPTDKMETRTALYVRIYAFSFSATYIYENYRKSKLTK